MNTAATDQLKKIVDILDLRKFRFELAADIFGAEMKPESLKRILGVLENLADGFNDGTPEDTLVDSLKNLAFEDFDAFATKTRTEYARMFIGPKKVLVPLHESAYRSGTARMFTQHTLAVRKFYKRFGYEMVRKNKEPDDSIATELEFLAILCTVCIESLNNVSCKDDHAVVGASLRAQEEFKEQHLGKWADAFIKGILLTDQSDFYRIWATYLSDILAEDTELLATCKSHLEVYEDVLLAG